MSMYEAEGKIKFMQNYADPGEKPNWYVIINDMDDQDHRAYSSQDLSEYKKKLDKEDTVLISAKGEKAVHKSGKNEGKNFISKAVISDWLAEDKQEVKTEAPVVTNGSAPKENVQFDNSLKIAEMTLLYKTCMEAVNGDEMLGSLEESNRKDISTTFFLSLVRR